MIIEITKKEVIALFFICIVCITSFIIGSHYGSKECNTKTGFIERVEVEKEVSKPIVINYKSETREDCIRINGELVGECDLNDQG